MTTITPAAARQLASPTGIRRLPAVKPAAAPMVTTLALAEDWFVGHSYKVGNAASIGRGVDVGVQTARTLRKDVQSLAGFRNLSGQTRVALTAKVLCDTESMLVAGEEMTKGVTWAATRMAQGHGAAKTAGLQTLATMGEVKAQVGAYAVNTTVISIHRAAAAGSLALAAVSLPALSRSAMTKTVTAVMTCSDKAATRTAKLNALKDAAYTGAACLGAAASVPGSITTLATVGSITSPFSRQARILSRTPAFAAASRVSKVLMPVADGIILGADAITVYQTFNDPKASSKQRVRAVMNVSIAATKMVTYAFPKSGVAGVVYTVAGMTQLGLGLYDMATARKQTA